MSDARARTVDRPHVPERSTSDADPRVAAREAPSEDDAVARRMEGPAPTGPAATASEEVLVLDFGGQYSQLIARRIRECGVFSELLPHDTPLDKIKERAPKGLVLSGGPASVYSEGAPGCARSCSTSGFRCSASVTGCS